jgi:energy-coupling factor transporter ATP-binding protein EcfA2
VIEFAELEEFVELKLKNYSSGMRVRLGFAVLVEADADIMLIDEVLAVGDAAFQQKCTDVFYDFKRRGRTIVLVTHDMGKLEEYSDRAVLLHEGGVEEIGDVDAVAARYMELNFSGDGSGPRISYTEDEFAGSAGITSFRFENGDGEEVDQITHGEPIVFSAEIEVFEQIGHSETARAGTFIIVLRNAEHQKVFELRSDPLTGSDGPLHPGERLSVRGRIDNDLVDGRYTADLSLSSFPAGDMTMAYRHGAADLLIYGTDAPSSAGLIVPEHRIEIERASQRAPQLD